MSAERFDGWFPIRVYWTDDGPMLDWCRLGDVRFREPFFEQAVRRCLLHPFNLALRMQTPIDALGAYCERRPGLRPDGLIFHMSRCGSTLAAQMLASMPRTLVISEAGPIDAILTAARHDPRVREEDRIRWLRWIVSALGQRWNGDEEHYVIKLDAWHVLDLPLIERAFPGVPWIFVHRDPLEVLVSHQRTMSWMMSAQRAPVMLDIPMTDAIRIPREEYHARVIARICDAVAANGGKGRFVAYDGWPEAMTSVLADFGIAASDDDLRTMRITAAYHAKQPEHAFVPDSAEKRQSADAAVKAAVAQWLAPAYERLLAATS